jgi:putative oxidoreductase
MAVGLLILRIVVGLILGAHGAQKLFGWFGGRGMEGTSGMLNSLGFSPARGHAVLNGVSEVGGGLLLAVGLFTPFAAAAIIGVMVVAIATVHWTNGFFVTQGGYEFNLALIGGAAALAFIGPGSFSLDHAFGIALRGGGWGLAALLIATVAAGGVLGMRTKPAPQEAPAR